MEIYLLKYNDCDYGDCDSFIAIAENEEEARKMHPNTEFYFSNDKWMFKNYLEEEFEVDFNHRWIEAYNIDMLEVIHIGKADENQMEGVLIFSILEA